ncbi:MAG: M23 family metallopeptidase, partial [Clostridia bacterium]|nr:M23 family metallopeptidase [Clostridia bacterium]
MYKGVLMRRLLIGLRSSIKLITLLTVSSIIIIAIIMAVYKPIYSVTLNGEMIGYSENKAALQKKLLQYQENGEDGDDAAFINIDRADYKLCFLKRGIETNDEEIYQKVIATAVPYYKFYSVAVSGEEKVYVASLEEAKSIINKLVEKDSKNANNLSIQTKYETAKKEFTEVATAVTELYENKITPEIARNMGRVARASSGGTTRKQIPIQFVKPIRASITSRFGARWGTTHKGLDFGAATGTPIKAAAEGTVTFSGWNSGGFGYLVIISHGNGVQTYYGHCSELDCKVGDYVYQGDVIAKVGNTGDSYGSHLHFEIR